MLEVQYINWRVGILFKTFTKGVVCLFNYCKSGHHQTTPLPFKTITTQQAFFIYQSKNGKSRDAGRQGTIPCLITRHNKTRGQSEKSLEQACLVTLLPGRWKEGDGGEQTRGWQQLRLDGNFAIGQRFVSKQLSTLSEARKRLSKGLSGVFCGSLWRWQL